MPDMISTAWLTTPSDTVKRAAAPLRGRHDAERKSIPPGSVFDPEKLKAALGAKAFRRLTEGAYPGLVPVNGAPGDPEMPDAHPPKTVVYRPEDDPAKAGKKVATLGGRKIDTDADEPGPSALASGGKTRRTK